MMSLILCDVCRLGILMCVGQVSKRRIISKSLLTPTEQRVSLLFSFRTLHLSTSIGRVINLYTEQPKGI